MEKTAHAGVETSTARTWVCDEEDQGNWSERRSKKKSRREKRNGSACACSVSVSLRRWRMNQPAAAPYTPTLWSWRETPDGKPTELTPSTGMLTSAAAEIWDALVGERERHRAVNSQSLSADARSDYWSITNHQSTFHIYLVFIFATLGTAFCLLFSHSF